MNKYVCWLMRGHLDSFIRNLLDEHIESNHPSLICVECGKTLRSKPDLYLHIHRDHKETLENTSQTSQTIVVCSPDRDPTTCNSFTDSQDNLNLPSVGMHDRPSLSQGLQGGENVQGFPLQSADQPILILPRLPCHICGQVFNSTDDLKFHLLEHGPTSYFSCNLCKENFRDQICLVKHLHTVHGLPTTAVCTFCDQVFLDTFHLNQHTCVNHNSQTGIICTTCGKTYPDTDVFWSHVCTEYSYATPDFSQVPPDLVTTHETSTVISCSLCKSAFQSHEDLAIHNEYHHTQPELHCQKCEKTFNDMRLLNIHNMRSHTSCGVSENQYHVTSTHLSNTLSDNTVQEAELDTNNYLIVDSTNYNNSSVCNKSFPDNPSFGEHLDTYHVSSPQGLSPIPQLDGNDDLDLIMNGTGGSSNLPHAVSSTPDLTYNYSLNTQNQSRRLLTSALKSPLSITYKHFEVIDSIRYAFNVNIDCNSGVYLTAIKPMLETVNTDWKVNVDRWTVSCCSVSNRQDNTGRHLLCTVLSLAITDNDLSGASLPCKVTLHFYHTKDKIQVQSTAILTPGTSAATWLVKSLIEPLASDHIANNQQSIEDVNNAILSSVTNRVLECHACHSNVEPNASQVKDRPLSCQKCSKIFHKKCTDRSGTKGINWNRGPWFCSACLVRPAHLGEPTPSPVPTSSTSLTTPLLSLPTLGLSPVEEDTSIVVAGIPTTDSPRDQPSSASATQNSAQQLPRFPPSTRHRRSNVNVHDAETEFQKAALDACRSTIVQQEAEIKKLNEAMDIRNKKIMQLEGQIGTATSHLANRDHAPAAIIPSATSDQLGDILSILHSLLSKLSVLTDQMITKSPIVNVYNSQSGNQKQIMLEKESQTSDTDSIVIPASNVVSDCITDKRTKDSETVLTCTMCSLVSNTTEDLDQHMENSHGNTGAIKCDQCNAMFSSKKLLNIHQSEKHPVHYIQCSLCKLRVQNRSKLELHIKESHGSRNVTPSLALTPSSVSTSSSEPGPSSKDLSSSKSPHTPKSL